MLIRSQDIPVDEKIMQKRIDDALTTLPPPLSDTELDQLALEVRTGKAEIISEEMLERELAAYKARFLSA